MAEADVTLPGLGKYYSSITLYDYERPNMFDTATPRRINAYYLPLPDGLTDTSQAEWGDASQAALGTLFQKPGKNELADYAQGASDALAAAALGGVGAMASSVKNMVTGGTGIVSNIVDNLVPADAITAFVQQSISGGAVQNPNPTQIFRGPSLRSYSLGWTFMPRSKIESDTAKEIITALKQASLPMPRYSDTMAILAYPKLVRVNFYPWDGNGSGKHGWSDDSIIRYKTSVITSMSVNYAPTNVPAFNTDDQRPAIITMRLDLKETEYMLAGDWGSKKKYYWQGDSGAPAGEKGPWTEVSEFIAAVAAPVKDALVNVVNTQTANLATTVSLGAPATQPTEPPATQ